MNKLVLVLFIVVLVLTLGVIGFYLYSTFLTSPKPSTFQSPSSFPTPISLSGISFAEAKIQAKKDCRKIGSTYEEAKDYLDNLFKKTSWQEDGVDTFYIVDIGDSCWGVVVSGPEGEGNFYYENSQNILTAQKISQFSP